MVKIHNHVLSNYGDPFIVAEAGINHNGELQLAFDMIEVAKTSGANAVKFQTYKTEEVCGDETQMFTYQSQGKEVTESMVELFSRYEFSRDEWKAIKQKCDGEGILFLSTPQNRSDLDLLVELGIPAIKVGSDDFVNLPLLSDYATTKLPMIVSCGMADMAEVYQALDAIGTFDGYPTVLLLCTSQYPTPPDDVNLLKLKTLADSFPDLVLGFSDHTQGSLASSLAVSFGAVLFEKHFTMDNDLPGPDHWFSENPATLKRWVDGIHDSYKMMGDGLLRPTKGELLNKLEFQRVLVANENISEGEVFKRENITLSRVSGGKGLPPSFMDRIIGSRSNREYKKNEVIFI
ncbi:N-acetylneuraminate synthase family protein [Pseudomonadales bacterium]|nr:N-acetylneuraminate synthase family protein [Pseudomonadales bacterium]